jgi:hypothetical protein
MRCAFGSLNRYSYTTKLTNKDNEIGTKSCRTEDDETADASASRIVCSTVSALSSLFILQKQRRDRENHVGDQGRYRNRAVRRKWPASKRVSRLDEDEQ